MSILEEKRNLIIIAIAALVTGSVLIIVLKSGSMNGGNDTLPADINESQISPTFEQSPKFEKRLYELLGNMSPGDKIQVSIWLKVPGSGHRETPEEKKKFYADIEKPVIDYLNSREIEIQYASMFAPLIYAEISKQELFTLVKREDVTGIYVTFSYSIKREKPVYENKTTIEEIIPMVEATGQAFDESAGILTNRWDARNFEGFWRDEETGASTEELVIDQSINSHRRVIEKRNLIYRTRVIPSNFIVFRHRRNQGWASLCGYDDPDIKKKSYQALGWLGEKHAFLGGNNISRIIEQNASDEKTITIGETWDIGEGYRITANSIDAKAGVPQAWITLSKDGVKLDDIVLALHSRNIYNYMIDDQPGTPIFITHLAKLSTLAYSDGATFKYTWLRSPHTTEIKPGDIFGIMEVTSVDNGTIELRNREPIVLEPGYTISLIGNISFQVENSSTGLVFYPHSTRAVRENGTYPLLIGTISTEHPGLKSSYSLMNEIIKDYDLIDYKQECSDGGEKTKFNIHAHNLRQSKEEDIIITLHAGQLRTVEIEPWKGEEVISSIVAIGGWSGYTSPAFFVVNNRTEWNRIWYKHVSLMSGEWPSPPVINFTDQTLVAVFSGESPAFEIGLIYITREGNNIYVNLEKSYRTSHSSGQPYFIVSIPKTADNILMRTLRVVNKTQLASTRGDKSVQAVSRKYGIPENRLTLSSSMIQGSSVNYAYTWIGVVMDKTTGKNYSIYLDDSGNPVGY